jgi:hypothetical protein
MILDLLIGVHACTPVKECEFNKKTDFSLYGSKKPLDKEVIHA